MALNMMDPTVTSLMQPDLTGIGKMPDRISDTGFGIKTDSLAAGARDDLSLGAAGRAVNTVSGFMENTSNVINERLGEGSSFRGLRTDFLDNIGNNLNAVEGAVKGLEVGEPLVELEQNLRGMDINLSCPNENCPCPDPDSVCPPIPEPVANCPPDPVPVGQVATAAGNLSSYPPDTFCPNPDTFCPSPDANCPTPDANCPTPDSICPDIGCPPFPPESTGRTTLGAESSTIATREQMESTRLRADDLRGRLDNAVSRAAENPAATYSPVDLQTRQVSLNNNDMREATLTKPADMGQGVLDTAEFSATATAFHANEMGNVLRLFR